MKIERKIYEAEVKAFDDEKLWIDHFISTEKRDRGRDILKADGMKVFGKVVVLHSHGWGPMGSEPIAKNLSLKPGDFKGRPGIVARTQFWDGSHLTPPDNTGRRLYEKTKTGVMPNWSVGWRPLKEEYVRDKGGEETRLVTEWELLEYSIVAVPMQPDAQTLPEGKEDDEIQFKVFTDLEEKLGELIAYRNEAGEWEAKPYPNEHACRLEDPDKYIRIRRENDALGSGVHAIWGVQAGSKPVELQAIRLSLSKFTAAEARAWLKAHDYKCKSFEPATGKCETCGGDMVWQAAAEESCKDECGLGIFYCPACVSNEEKDLAMRLVERKVTLKEWRDYQAEKMRIKIDKEIMEALSQDEAGKEAPDWAAFQKDFQALLSRFDALEAEIDSLKGTVKPEPVPDDPKEDSGDTPPELVINRDDLAQPNAKDAIIGAIREVVGEKIQSDIDRMKGKIR